jgi:feruloyl-CoA synthase
MLCANQAMLRQVWPVLTEKPPVLVDWLPWSHTFGANFTFGIALFNGGHYHIDAGKPVPGAIDTTLRNIADVRPTLYFNVPAGYEAILTAMQNDPTLAERFFDRLDFLFCAAAALPQKTRDGLARAAGARAAHVPVFTGWGSTETAPCATAIWFDNGIAGNLGAPLPGVAVRLVPDGNKLELRVKAPTVTPGYWRSPEATAAAFDADGFYRMGDAGKLVDPLHPERGILFDGRVSENFKLATGTWVNVGALRMAIVEAASPLVRDVAVTGHDRDDIGALIFLNHPAARAIDGCADLAEAALVAHPGVLASLRALLRNLRDRANGSSTRIARFAILPDAPRPHRYEITDKGYLNQRGVLSERSDAVAALYASDATKL